MSALARIFLPAPGSIGSVTPEQRLQAGGAYKDKTWALAFIVHVLLIAAIGFGKGIPALTSSSSGSSSSGSSSTGEEVPISNDVQTFLRGLLVVLLITPLVCCFLAYFYVRYIKDNSAAIVECSVKTYVVIWLAAAAYMAIAVAAEAAVPFALIALILICWYQCIKKRIPFMAAHLKCAAEAVTTHPSMITYSVFMIVPAILWILTWDLGVAGVMEMAKSSTCPSSYPNQNPNDEGSCCKEVSSSFDTGVDTGDASVDTDDASVNTQVTVTFPDCTYTKKPGSVTVFLLLISFYWGGQVVKNIVHCTCCGATGSWWFLPHSPGAVSAAFKRATTTSFGSICLGSLIVAVLKALEAMLKDQAKKNIIAACIMQCIRELMEYFNKYAYVYVSLYGLDFRNAGKAVFNLFSESGWTVIIHDDLLGVVLFFGALGIALSGVVIGTGYAQQAQDYDEPGMRTLATVVYGFIGFLAGIFASFQVFSVLNSAFATVLVAWAEDPQALNNSHPALYANLYNAWLEFHHDIFVAHPQHATKYTAPESKALVASGPPPPGVQA